MKTLTETDYVIYDEANDHVLQLRNGNIAIFGSKDEADADCRRNEIVIACTKLPVHWQDVLLKQINNQDQ